MKKSQKRRLDPRFLFKMTITFFAAVIFLVLHTNAQQLSSKVRECDHNPKDAVKYRLISKDVGINEPYVVQLFIVVDRKNFTAGFMEKLAQTLREKYCHADNLGAAIFDEKRAAKRTDLAKALLGTENVTGLRGLYSLDRKRNKESIAFSKDRRNRFDEIVIDLIKPQ
jgi:hypothetical protein